MTPRVRDMVFHLTRYLLGILNIFNAKHAILDNTPGYSSPELLLWNKEWCYMAKRLAAQKAALCSDYCLTLYCSRVTIVYGNYVVVKFTLFLAPM